jgi:hypothetical protein
VLTGINRVLGPLQSLAVVPVYGLTLYVALVVALDVVTVNEARAVFGSMLEDRSIG